MKMQNVTWADVAMGVLVVVFTVLAVMLWAGVLVVAVAVACILMAGVAVVWVWTTVVVPVIEWAWDRLDARGDRR